MMTDDHVYLAKHFFYSPRVDLNIDSDCKRLFVIGNAEPDYNVFSYVKGSFFDLFLRGHNFENSFEYVKKSIDILLKVQNFKRVHFFALGKLLHYVVDWFTYPHNLCFEGNLAEHNHYEKGLHRLFCEYVSDTSFEILLNFDKENLLSYLVSLHNEYLKKPSFENDCKYIFKVYETIFSTFMFRATLYKDEIKIISQKNTLQVG